MKLGRFLLVLWFLWLARPSVSQTVPPRILLQALHCARTDKFGLLDANLRKGDLLKVAYARYSQTDPSMEGLVLVTYESSSTGQVLDYEYERDHGRFQFNLVNNASFAVSPGNILSVDDALGGVWTQDHLKQRVKRAIRGAGYSIPARSLIGPSFHDVGCHSYYDN